MKEDQLLNLSKRERQIMDVVYMLGEATAADILEHLPAEVGDDSIRKLIRVVEAKGYLTHRREGPRYVYQPTIPSDVASQHALHHTLQTFFRGSAPKIVSALLTLKEGELSEEEIAEIAALIRQAKERGE